MPVSQANMAAISIIVPKSRRIFMAISCCLPEDRKLRVIKGESPIRLPSSIPAIIIRKSKSKYNRFQRPIPSHGLKIKSKYFFNISLTSPRIGMVEAIP